MTKKQFLQAFIFILFFILNLFLTNKIFATTLTLNPSKDSVGIGEQFYVDLMLNPENKSINAISGDISFSNNISFLRAENGKSMVNLWVEQPKLDVNTVSFAGVISNGFDGVIDPFNQSQKLPGLITRLVFEAGEKSGQVNFSTSTFSLNLNDGLGTEIKAPSTSSFVKIGNFVNKIIYENKTGGVPELEAYVTRDINIFNNKYTLVFKATDKETGVKSVMIKEGRRDWKEIENPYLLEDQSRHSTIMLEATNFKGESIVIKIDKIPYDWKSLIQISIIVIIIITSFILIFKKIYAHKK